VHAGGNSVSAAPKRTAAEPYRQSDPAGFFESVEKERAKRGDRCRHHEIAVPRFQFGHVLKVHPVDPGNCRRNGEDGSPGRQLASDGALPLLLQQVAGLERGGDDLAQTADHALDAPHVIEDVAEVRLGVVVDAGQIEVCELTRDLGHRMENALEQDDLPPQAKNASDFLALEKRY